MENIFTVGDVVDIGIQKEIARRDYYGQVSEAFDDEELKGLFAKLRDWEAGHIKKFEKIRNNLKEKRTKESYPGELQAYMDALVDNKLYTEVSPDQFAKNVKTPIRAIEYGIAFEKDAIMLFMELLGYVKSSQKEVITELMEEERHHIVFLIKLKKKFK